MKPTEPRRLPFLSPLSATALWAAVMLACAAAAQSWPAPDGAAAPAQAAAPADGFTADVTADAAAARQPAGHDRIGPDAPATLHSAVAPDPSAPQAF